MFVALILLLEYDSVQIPSLSGFPTTSVRPTPSTLLLFETLPTRDICFNISVEQQLTKNRDTRGPLFGTKYVQFRFRYACM